MRKLLYAMGTGLAAGVIAAAGFTQGAGIAEDNLLHAERFEAVTIDSEGFYGEPVDKHGERITGEGVALDVTHVPIEANEGDIVTVYWTQAQAEHGDWNTPAKIELEEEK